MNIENFQLKYNDGKKFDLFEYLGSSWGIVFFYRGVWCTLCKKQLKEFHNHYAKFEELNVKIVAISNDTKLKSNLAENFFNLQFPVISDAKMKVIKELDLKTEFKGQTTSKPAVYIVNSEKETVFEFIGDNHDDRFVMNDLIEKIKELQK